MNEDLSRLIKEQQSAFYLFDVGKLKKRIEFLKNHFKKEAVLCYAVKANPFIVGEIKDELERFEICSPGETEICTSVGVSKNKMVISGIYKTPKVIESLLADSKFDGIFTVESIQQYILLFYLSLKYNKSICVLLRLTNGSQFGMDETDIEKIINERRIYSNINILGIQFFSGTQKTSLKKYKREIEFLDQFLIHLKEKYGFEAQELEYGTGFPVAYFETDEINEEELFDGFKELLHNMVCKPKITLEIGRSIAASCGQYYSKIVDIKQNKGQNYALIDGGMHHIMYFGQHMAMKQPFLSVVGKKVNSQDSLWTICGSLCTMNDIITKQICLPDIKIGDTICFEKTGAYCMTECISLFLSRDLPAVYLMKENGDIICVRKTFETALLNTPNYERMF